MDFQHTIIRFIEGVTDSVCPVNANRDLPASIQSVVPSKFTVVIDVLAALVDMSAVTGLVDDILWYRKGILSAALRKGSSIESVETTFRFLVSRFAYFQ